MRFPTRVTVPLRTIEEGVTGTIHPAGMSMKTAEISLGEVAMIS
jgi:hypothetical protein